MAQDKPPFWSTKEFKALNAKWAKRLEESGFEDAERLVNDDYVLIDFHQHKFGRTDRNDTLTTENRAEYYRLAGQFLHTHKFKSKRDSFIWQLHCEGLSRAKILRRLKAARMSMSDTAIFHVIKELSDIMKSQTLVHEDNTGE